MVCCLQLKEKLEEKISKYNAAASGESSEKARLTQSMEDAEQNRTKTVLATKTAKAEVDKLKVQCREDEREVLTIKKQMQKNQEKEDGLMKEVKALDSVSKRDYAAEDRAREEKKNVLRTKIEALAKKIQRLQEESNKEEDEDYEKLVREAQEDMQSRRKQLKKAEQEIKDIETGSKEEGARFGQFMPQLLQEIQRNASKFSMLPVGPLGSLIRLQPKNDKWATAVEGVLGSPFLQSFVVDNYKDATTLKQIMHEKFKQVKKCRFFFLSSSVFCFVLA